MQPFTAADLIEGLRRLERVIIENQTVRTMKDRVVVKKAKNIQNGDLVDFSGYGQHEVSGWSMSKGHVILSCSTGYFATFGSEQRVRVVRKVPVGA